MRVMPKRIKMKRSSEQIKQKKAIKQFQILTSRAQTAQSVIELNKGTTTSPETQPAETSDQPTPPHKPTRQTSLKETLLTAALATGAIFTQSALTPAAAATQTNLREQTPPAIERRIEPSTKPSIESLIAHGEGEGKGETIEEPVKRGDPRRESKNNLGENLIKVAMGVPIELTFLKGLV